MSQVLVYGNESVSVNHTKRTDGTPVLGNAAPALRFVFAAIGVLSIVNNGALCIVLLRKKAMMKKSYNLMVMALAVVDTSTGFLMLTNPTILGNDVWPIPAGIQGELFCKIMQTNFLLKLLWKYSISIVVAMTIERWYAITRPLRYKRVYKSRNVLLQLFSLLVFSFIILVPQLFTIRLGRKDSRKVCIINTLMNNIVVSEVYAILYSCFTFVVPFVVIIAVYVHLRLVVIRKQKPSQRHRREVETRLLRMNAVVSICLGVLFGPSHVSLILLKFGVVNHFVLRASVAVSMLNSIVNPWIYCITNSKYRTEFALLLCHCYKKAATPETSPPTEQNSWMNESNFEMKSSVAKVSETKDNKLKTVDCSSTRL